MDNKNFKTVSISFLLGAVVGITMLAVSGFTNGNSQQQASQTTINSNEANTLFKKYYENASATNAILKGVCIDMGQYNAMKSLMEGGEAPAAFRVYFGQNDQGAHYGMVVGVNSEGNDMTSGTIYRTDQGNLGPCPNICDVASPITAD